MASRPGPAGITALAQPEVAPVFLAWLDVVGDPVRATTARIDISPAATGDPDLDGKLFSAVDAQFVSVSEVQAREGGMDTVTVSLSGLIGPDNDLLNIIGNTANWRGREARLWQGVETAGGGLQFWSYFTGRMSAIDFAGSASGQTVIVSIETYLAALSPASNRTYLDQKIYDPGDNSAAATIACANGIGGSGTGSVPGNGGGGGGGGGGEYYTDREYLQ